MREDQEQFGVKRGRRGPGCGWTMFLLGGVAVGAGAYLMNGWDALPGYGKAGAVVLTVLGTLLMLPTVLFLALKLLMWVILGRLTKGARGVVESMMKLNQGLYGKVHEFREADEDDYDSADRARYDAAARELAAAGFRHLGDVVDATISEMGLPSPVIRVLSAPDGSASAGLYHLPDPSSPGGGGGDEPITCDLESEFSDGTFLATNNTAGRDLTTPAPPVERRQHPPETPLAELVRLHQQEVQKLLAAKPGASAVPLHTLADVMKMQKRLQAAKNAFREQIGYVDAAEVRRIAERTEGAEGITEPVVEAVEQIKRERRARDGG